MAQSRRSVPDFNLTIDCELDALLALRKQINTEADGKYKLSEAQARAILELRLHRLTGLERDKIGEDLRELGAQIEEYLSILASREKLYGILRDELLEMREQFADDRRTTIEKRELFQWFAAAALIIFLTGLAYEHSHLNYGP